MRTGKIMKQELSDLSVRELALRVRQGKIELADVVNDVLAARAENASNPMFITVVPEQELRKRAEELASLSAAVRAKMPLYGVPFVVKDNIDVVGYDTTAGCPEYAYRPDKNAFIVDRLLEAGAIFVAKANLDQFATGLTGMRSVYGFPQNPYSPDHIVGGSSSGPASPSHARRHILTGNRHCGVRTHPGRLPWNLRFQAVQWVTEQHGRRSERSNARLLLGVLSLAR
jgi:allophanate hydrolase